MFFAWITFCLYHLSDVIITVRIIFICWHGKDTFTYGEQKEYFGEIYDRINRNVQIKSADSYRTTWSHKFFFLVFISKTKQSREIITLFQPTTSWFLYFNVWRDQKDKTDDQLLIFAYVHFIFNGEIKTYITLNFLDDTFALYSTNRYKSVHSLLNPKQNLNDCTPGHIFEK